MTQTTMLDVLTPIQQGPRPGDAVRCDWQSRDSIIHGKIGIIDSIYFPKPADKDQSVLVTWRYSTFRGRPSMVTLLEMRIADPDLDPKDVLTDTGDEVSSSGGPGLFVHIRDLTRAGEYAVWFWRWNQYGPGAGNSDNYQLTVPLWSWRVNQAEE